MINPENFRYSYFAHEHLKAFIAEGADQEAGEVKFLYFVTLRNESEEKDMMQKSFEQLPHAVEFVNNQYSIMNFTDMRVKSGEGCDTCAAK